MNKINNDGSINHGKYKIVKFTANGDNFYQVRIKMKNIWWYCKNFHKSILSAGDEARKIIY